MASPNDKPSSSEHDRGREAHKPTDIPARGWNDIVRRTFQQLSEDNLSIVAAGVAFYSFTATVPALAAMIATYALIADPATVTGHIESFAGVLPEQTRPLLHDQLTRLSSNDNAAGWGAVAGPRTFQPSERRKPLMLPSSAELRT